MENDNPVAESSGQRLTPDSGQMFCFSVPKSTENLNVTQGMPCQYVTESIRAPALISTIRFIAIVPQCNWQVPLSYSFDFRSGSP